MTSTPMKRDHDEAELSDLSAELENKIPALFDTPPGITLSDSQPKQPDLKMPDDTPEWAKTIFAQFWEQFIESSNHQDSRTLENAQKVESVEKSIKKINERLDVIENKLQSKISVLEEENRQIHTKMIKLESYSRRNNLLILGVPEYEGETSVDMMHTVKWIFYNIGVEYPENLSIIKCHRKGTPNFNARLGRFYGAPRPIIVRFQNPADRDHVWELRYYLKDLGYTFADDLPEEIERNRKTLWPAYKKARSMRNQYHHVDIVEDRLIIDNKTYTVHNMNTLPKEINPATKAERSNDDKIAFFGKESPLSNHHPATFQLNGLKYNSSEQYLMSEKAILFSDEETAHKIMVAKNPVVQKHLGKKVEKVRGYSEQKWQNHAPKIMEKAINAKFSQNSSLKKWLLDTNQKHLMEASRDKFWGVGASLHDKKILSQEWPGNNQLGKTLMKVRSQLAPKS